jgi:hypothetical protein
MRLAIVSITLALAIGPLVAGPAAAAPDNARRCYFLDGEAKAADFGDDPNVKDVPLDLGKWGLKNCWADEIFVLDGDEKVDDKPLSVCGTDTGKPKDCSIGWRRDDPTPPPAMPGEPPPPPAIRWYSESRALGEDTQRVAQKAVEVLKAQGVKLPEKGWDEIVVFMLDFAKDSNPDGPLFFRPREADGTPVNVFGNIGLKKTERPKDLPYLGVVFAGGTRQIPSDPTSGAFSACGRAPRRPTDPQSDVTIIAQCSPGVASYFDTLAQATANLYGPYLQTDPRWLAPGVAAGAGWGLASWHGNKSKLVDPKSGKEKIDIVDPTTKRDKMFGMFAPRIWSSFFDKVSTDPEDPKRKDMEADLRLAIIKEVSNALATLQRQRRNWNAGFHMLTHWRGRMITTFEGDVDDEPYWEFGHPPDDAKTFEAGGGLRAEFKGLERVPNSTDMTTALGIDTPGERGFIRYRGFPNYEPGARPVPIRISADQEGRKAPNNIVTVRLRISGVPAARAYALVSFDGNPCTLADWKDGARPCVRLPNNEKAFLIPDQKWRNYSANLSKVPAFTGVDPKAPPDARKDWKVWNSIVLVPSSEPTPDRDPKLERPYLEVEFVRVAHVSRADDTDKDCSGKALPDGWVDAEDNCPALYNPLQEDGNEDGVGDACSDFDGDNVANKCDNCPTLTNSRQRDVDDDGKGDICDEERAVGCIFQPDSVAGRLPPAGGAGGAALALALLAAAVAIARRTTRRR